MLKFSHREVDTATVNNMGYSQSIRVPILVPAFTGSLNLGCYNAIHKMSVNSPILWYLNSSLGRLHLKTEDLRIHPEPTVKLHSGWFT